MANEAHNFIREIIRHDLEAGSVVQVVTRFPPEPNGYLHIGHAKAICVNFGLAEEFGGLCNLRFDDTNPTAEDQEYVDAIAEDVAWLGFRWAQLTYASDTFEQLYQWAEHLVLAGKAYVDDCSEEQLREARGTVTEAGRPTPGWYRSVAENLDLLRRMRAGEFADGAMVLRARIDLGHSNMKLRDPLLYRIRHVHHQRTGHAWCIYPFYDYAHGQGDALEGITHSVCSLEFQDNRELYDWFLDNLPVPARPHQYEMARLELDHTITSKRKLRRLVEEGHVSGWDDPRLPTLRGLRRRGVRPEAIRSFIEARGVSKTNAVVEMAALESHLRDDLNAIVPRVMGVAEPLPVVVENWGEHEVDWLDAPLYPHDVPLEGSRRVPFTRTVVIEASDFAEHPPKGFKRLVPGGEVRLRYAWILRCTGVERGPDGRVTGLRGTVDRDSRGGHPADGRKVAGTIHWVSASLGVRAELRLVDRLFAVPLPGAERDVVEDLNPDGLVVREGLLEPHVAGDPPGTRYQLERLGYFMTDLVDHAPGRPVLVRTVALKDSWTRAELADARPGPVLHAFAPGGAPDAAGSDWGGSAGGARRELDLGERTRLARWLDVGVPEEEARVLEASPALAAVVDGAVAAGAELRRAASLVANDLRRLVDPSAAIPVGGAQVARLLALEADGTLSTALGRRVLAVLVEEGGDPAEVAAARGWAQVSDEAGLRALVAEVLAANPSQVERYRAGNVRMAGFFVGQVMQRTQGRANPPLVARLVDEALAG